MGRECMGNTLPIISLNYSKVLKGFEPFKQEAKSSEGYLQECSVPVPFKKRIDRKVSISQRMEGWREFETLQEDTPKSIGVFVRLYDGFAKMTKDPFSKKEKITYKLWGLT